MDHNCNVEERIDPDDHVVYFVAVCPDCDYDGEPEASDAKADEWGENHCNLMNFGMNLETGETYTSEQPNRLIDTDLSPDGIETAPPPLAAANVVTLASKPD